jgi:hypothetical protein
MIRKLILAVVIFSPVLLAQFQRPGSTDAQFLKIGISPRGTAMGDAYISVVEGAEGTFYNSAAINHDYAAAAHSFGDIGTFGAAVTALYTDLMKVRTPLQPDGTGETFYAGNYKFGLSYSRYFTEQVTVGLTLNYINMTLYKGFSADAFSVDIATMYTSEFRGFKFAMQISNFGSQVKYVNESYPLPTAFTFGASVNAVDGEDQKVIVSFAATKPNDGQPLTQVGGEWNFQNTFFARAGYKINYDIATYSFGAGVKLNLSGLDTRVDYSYSKFGLLGAAHRVGIGVNIQ